MSDFSILMSIKPQYTHEIFHTKNKRIELRKSSPRRYKGHPFIVYVYESGSGKVIGEFTCWCIRFLDEDLAPVCKKVFCDAACVTMDLFSEYKPTRAYTIKNSHFYENPIPFTKFAQIHKLSKKPPQSWCYIDF